MGDINQIIFGKKYLPKDARYVLEVGSKNYGNTSSFRDHFTNAEYVGVDIEAGDGVDVVCDLENDNLITSVKQKFDAIICCSILEHTPKPWKMADNISLLTMTGGTLYLSVPWVQRYHMYPDDYYRFSPRGIEILFPDFEWSHQCFSTTKEGEFIPFKKGVDNKMHMMHDGRKYLPYFFTNMIGIKK